MEVAFNTTPSIPTIHTLLYIYNPLNPTIHFTFIHQLSLFTYTFIMSSDSGRLSGQHRAPEKSNFSHTCNLFSQYLKENSFPDLTLGRRATPSTATMNLFPVTETPRTAVYQQQATTTKKQQDHESRSMTIFYNGQVIVFNDLTPEKVKEIMMLAEKGVVSGQKPPPPTATTFSSASSVCTPKPDEPLNNKIKHPLPVASGSDLPIARKASLARFLEKRKDRIIARSPYQIEGDSKKDDTKTWLGLGAQA
ncbi:hypothetical protein L6452_03950 [Arctium lappa]|uniref:Uncharacterized protein n=1 Tax=Arctium lappa TaxID=4217 RepID=A0ACB9FNL6_ARCLA|nr:hypothetical protein L6452_03950 [Arctium lappa]